MAGSESGEKSAQIKHCLQANTNMCVDFNVRDRRLIILLLTRIQIKNALKMDFFLKMLSDVLEWCELLWCFYQLFGLSF